MRLLSGGVNLAGPPRANVASIAVVLLVVAACGSGTEGQRARPLGNAHMCRLLDMPHKSSVEIQALSDEAGRLTLQQRAFVGTRQNTRIHDAALELHFSAKIAAFTTANPRRPFPSPGNAYVGLDTAIEQLRDACE